MKKEDFLNFPRDEFCTTCLSMGVPASGKTFIMLQCLKYFIEQGIFEEYHVVLPCFKNEMNKSYDWLLKYDNVFIYDNFYEKMAEKIIAKQEASIAKSKNDKDIPKVFVAIDDATGVGKLFESSALKRIITENRHLRVHSWILLHADKGVIPPKIRQNIRFVFLYKVKEQLLQHAFKEYVNFPLDFDNFKKDFKPFFKEYVIPHKYGCLLLAGSDSYNPDVHTWFEKEA